MLCQSLCQLVTHQGRVPDMAAPSNPWVCLCGIIQETGEILIFVDINGEFPNMSAMADLWLSVVLGCSCPGTDTGGMCQALRVTCFLQHQVRILHSRPQRGSHFIPFSFLIYATTVVLCVAMTAKLFKQRSWDSLQPKTLPLVPDSLCVTCFLEGTRIPLQCLF